MKSILLALTTYNHSDITKLCLEALALNDLSDIDVIVVDDKSSDDTEDVVKQFEFVTFITKETGKGLTDSWNIAYRYFDNAETYKYLIIANNDILIPEGSIQEMKSVLDKWPATLVVPMSTNKGVGHNKAQCIDLYYGADNERDNPNQYQSVQDSLLTFKQTVKSQNNLYLLDPIRMKMFNGFFFMMSRQIIQYEREDGNLFDPKFINVKNEDEFNWGKLIPNNDFPILCKTAFVFHMKGMSFNQNRELANTEQWTTLR